ncbi:MAG TPA: nucleoside diphosphate kinase regulator [Dongiaceae bacterium]|jgi:regulator of nucleoside diphosphate kinase|nr:nucleoside diphosphate kinase regulator [Dongiaceae bacterium]
MIRTRIVAADRTPITITDWNRSRLEWLLENHADAWSWRAAAFLARALARSRVVEEGAIPAGVVTMRSRIAFRDERTGARDVVTLAYPGERTLYEDGISVLTPVGAALLGRSEGESICCAAPDGSPKTISVLAVLYQPEAGRRIVPRRFKARPDSSMHVAL